MQHIFCAMSRQACLLSAQIQYSNGTIYYQYWVQCKRSHTSVFSSLYISAVQNQFLQQMLHYFQSAAQQSSINTQPYNINNLNETVTLENQQ